MIGKPCFASFSSRIKDGVGINIQKIIIVPSRIHSCHAIFALFGGNQLATIFQDK